MYDTNFPYKKLINNKYSNNNHPIVIYLSTIISSYLFSCPNSQRTSNADLVLRLGICIGLRRMANYILNGHNPQTAKKEPPP